MRTKSRCGKTDLLYRPWSPDGKNRIAATKYSVAFENRGYRFFNPVTDGIVTSLKCHAPWGAQPKAGSFSPAGRFIALLVKRTGGSMRAAIYVIAGDGTGEATIVAGPGRLQDSHMDAPPMARSASCCPETFGYQDLWFSGGLGSGWRPQGGEPG